MMAVTLPHWLTIGWMLAVAVTMLGLCHSRLPDDSRYGLAGIAVLGTLVRLLLPEAMPLMLMVLAGFTLLCLRCWLESVQDERAAMAQARRGGDALRVAAHGRL